MLADVAEMPRSALFPINWEALYDSLLSALLSRGTSISQRIGQPLELWSILVLAFLSMLSRAFAPFEKILATAAYKDTRQRVKRIAPLMVSRLFGMMSLPLPASDKDL